MTDIRSIGNGAPGRKDTRTEVIPSVLWIIKSLRDARGPIEAWDLADQAQVSRSTVWIWCRRLEKLGLAKRSRRQHGAVHKDYWSWI